MNWEKDALEIIEKIPVPPLMLRLAKLDGERRTRLKGEDTVTAKTAREAEKGYIKVLGKEAAETVRLMSLGEPVDIPDEFFEESEDDDLFSIQICPAKFGACTRDKREMIRRVLTPVRNKLKELDISSIIMEKARSPLMSHHEFRVSVIGCPNCCFSPYFSDFGIIAVYKPKIIDEKCIQCKACIRCCTENAIKLENDIPVIDYEKCVMCGACEMECSVDAIQTEKKGYKVVVGGTGSRHPQLAGTVAECADLEGVMKILEKAINLFKETPVGENEISFHELLKRYGPTELRI